MSKEERNIYTIKADENLGEVKIADEVVSIIAGLAAMEVDGIASMAGNATRELVSKESFGLSVVKLINSIYDSPRARVVSQSPTGSLNMRAIPCVMSKRIVYSKTPTV